MKIEHITVTVSQEVAGNNQVLIIEIDMNETGYSMTADKWTATSQDAEINRLVKRIRNMMWKLERPLKFLNNPEVI
jgi:hypothetical protein